MAPSDLQLLADYDFADRNEEEIRIEELSARAASVTEAIAALRGKRPSGSSPDEIAAMLDAIPDMRDALATTDKTELAEIFDAFDVTSTYDKPNARLELPRPSRRSW